MSFRRIISCGRPLVKHLCTEATSGSPVFSWAPAVATTIASSTRDDRSLYRRLSQLGLTGGSVTQVLNQYVMEGKSITKGEILRCVRSLRKYRRHQDAFEVFKWLERRKMNFSNPDVALQLDLIAKVKGLEAAESYFNSLAPSSKNMLTYGALLNCYCMELLIEKAENHFCAMEDLNLIRTSLPFTNLMTMYMKLGKPEKVPQLAQSMIERNIAPCWYTYSIWMQSYGSLNDMNGVETILERMRKDSEDKFTWRTYANLAAIYVKAGLVEKAELALKNLEEKMNPFDRGPYHFLLSLYANTSNHSEVNRVWNLLKTALPAVNNISYIVMLQALVKLDDIEGIKEVYKEWESRCVAYDMRLANVVINSFLSHDMHEEAVKVFENASKKSKGPFSKSREFFMTYLLKKRDIVSALKHLEASLPEEDDWSWNPSLVNLFFRYFEEEKDVEGAEEFVKVLKKFSGMLDSQVYCSLLKTYIAAGKVAPELRDRLEEDGVEINDEITTLLERACSEQHSP